MGVCFSCKKDIEASGRPGRGDACPRCGADVKVCLNCRHYDETSYNSCREPSAERVVNKDKSNFCDFFEFGGGKKGVVAKDDPMERLKDLFRK